MTRRLHIRLCTFLALLPFILSLITTSLSHAQGLAVQPSPAGLGATSPTASNGLPRINGAADISSKHMPGPRVSLPAIQIPPSNAFTSSATDHSSRPPSSEIKAQQQKDRGNPDATPEKDTPPSRQPLQPPAIKSYIEKALSVEDSSSKIKGNELEVNSVVQFGYSFFRPEAPAFAPLIDVPVGPDYLVGPGDTIVLTAWGSLDGTYTLEVNRSGELILPKVGPVRVWGVPFGKLTDILKNQLAKVFKDFQLSVNLGKLKMMKIYVVGEVESPGDYDLSSLATVINALSAAGGPTKNGSLRNIKVKRDGKVVETVDLYDFFLNGDKSRDIRLSPGDTVLVPVIGRVAGIAGNVRRPAIYELREERNLKDLLMLADGLLPTGYLQRLQISRVEAHSKNIVTDVSLDPVSSGKLSDNLTASISIQDMDLVKVFSINSTLRGYARLEGYVLRPGDYAVRPGMRISDLLSGDNILPEYYDEIGQLTRLYPPDSHPENILFNPAQALAHDPKQDLELREFDVITIFARWEMQAMPMVRISGEVQRPGEYRLFKNMNVRDLLVMAGNPTLTAYMRQAEINRIERTGESVTAMPVAINLEEALKNNPQHNIELQPFDELFVRSIPSWVEATDQFISLYGEVKFPGVYPIYKGERLSRVIERAGGFTDKAYPRGAKFTRISLQELQQKRMTEVLAKTEQELIKKQADAAAVATSAEELASTKAAIEGLRQQVEILKSAKAEGRLVIDLPYVLDELKGSPYDLLIQGGDTLEIPQTPSAVNVLGQVYNPTSLVTVDGKDVAYYLAKAGGPTRDAESDDIYVIKSNGSVISRQQVSLWRNLLFSGFMSTELDPGDTIIVPQRFEKVAWLREIKDISTILGQLAITAGVLIAAGL